MHYRKTTDYALSLPERLVRSLSGLVAGSVREIGEVVLPAGVRRSRFYSMAVGATLQFLIEQVAEIEKTGSEALPEDFMLRKVAGNVLDIAGIAAFHASPLWVFAALSDLAGAGRELIGEISNALHEEGLLTSGQHFTNVNDLLNGLEQTAAQMVKSVHMPPLNVEALRDDWLKFCVEAAAIPKAALPDSAWVTTRWNELKAEAHHQQISVLKLSALLTLASLRSVPENARWLSRAAKVSSRRTRIVIAQNLFDHYQVTLAEIQSVGYFQYWLRECQPYFKGAVLQFSIERQSMTEKLLNGVWPI